MTTRISIGSLAAACTGTLLCLFVGAAGQAPSPRVTLRDCRVAGFDGTARCGTLAVFENRATRTGRRIDLRIVVVPALAAKPAADPVFWLHGGPGAAATQAVGAVKGAFLEGVRKDRDVVFVDQRGTGQSNGLDCDIGDDPADLAVFFGPLFPIDLVRRCRDALATRADLRLYTTPLAMDDLDDVRAALGADRIDIVAASYGTIAAQVYLRQHPEHVRSVFLLGVATPGVKQPLLFARGAQHALERLFEDCAADAVCRGAFPNLPSEFAAVLDRFAAGALDVAMLDPAARERRTIRVSRDNYVERIRLLLYTTTFARFVPLVVHRAYENDYVPFETLAIRYNPGAILARGMYMTVTCSEGVPFIRPREIVEEARGTFVGEGRVRVHIDACKEWPHVALPARYIEPVKSDRPVIMFSGDVDGSTPPWFAERALRHLSHGRQVTARYYGHQLDSPCSWQVLTDLVAAGSVDRIDTTCAADIRRPPFATAIPPEMALR